MVHLPQYIQYFDLINQIFFPLALDLDDLGVFSCNLGHLEPGTWVVALESLDP
jgi:hypothetical protein